MEGPSKTLITRIGHKLRLLIFLQDGRITVDKSLADKAGVKQSYDKGITHTNLKVENAFVDVGVAFRLGLLH